MIKAKLPIVEFMDSQEIIDAELLKEKATDEKIANIGSEGD